VHEDDLDALLEERRAAKNRAFADSIPERDP